MLIIPAPKGGAVAATEQIIIAQALELYLEKENDVPDESQDNGGVAISNVGRIDTDQLHLVEGTLH